MVEDTLPFSCARDLRGGWRISKENGFLVMVNTDEDTPSPFQVLLTSAPPLVGNDSVATRLFDASYTKTLAPVANGSQAGFVLEDWIGPGEVNIYTLGSVTCGEAAQL